VEGEVFVPCHTEATDLVDMASAELSHSMEDISTALSLGQAVAAFHGAGAVVESLAADEGFVAGSSNIWIQWEPSMTLPLPEDCRSSIRLPFERERW
jgi:hypothetical protein